MRPMRPLRGGLALWALAALGGCTIVQPPLSDPAYGPVPPVMPPPAQNADGSIYNSYTNRFLFEDLRARRVGDVLTILLEEKTDAAKKASTATKKSAKVDVNAPTLFGRDIKLGGRPVLNNSLSSSADFSGDGSSSQSNSLKGSITVSVARVLPNGYLLVRGEKLLSLNQGSEVVRFSGIVRPYDIAPDNTVPSTKVANARITYRGRGIVADSNAAGWLTRFFHHPIWPF